MVCCEGAWGEENTSFLIHPSRYSFPAVRDTSPDSSASCENNSKDPHDVQYWLIDPHMKPCGLPGTCAIGMVWIYEWYNTHTDFPISLLVKFSVSDPCFLENLVWYHELHLRKISRGLNTWIRIRIPNTDETQVHSPRIRVRCGSGYGSETLAGKQVLGTVLINKVLS